MRDSTQVFLALFYLCMPALLHAQRDNSKCLVGTVPETDGKVVFTKDFGTPDMSQDTIYSRPPEWMDTRLVKNGNTSRMAYSDRGKGQIVGINDEWIMFSSAVPSLDGTKIPYQLTLTCQSEKYTLEVEKIRFSYREGKEKYTAGEWITDKYALNKSETRLVHGLAKWRGKTVDSVDSLCVNVTGILSISTATKVPVVKEEKERGTETAPAGSGTAVITPKTRTTVGTPKMSATPIAAIESTSAAYREVSPDAIPSDAIRTGNGKLVVVIGEEPLDMTMIMVNADGSLGEIAGNKVMISIILSPDQPYGQMDATQSYTVRFYLNRQNELSIIPECEKFLLQAPVGDMLRTYIGETLKTKIR